MVAPTPTSAMTAFNTVMGGEKTVPKIQSATAETTIGAHRRRVSVAQMPSSGTVKAKISATPNKT